MKSMPNSAVEARRRALSIDTPVQYLKGIGPRRSEQLAAQGVRTVGDLLEYPPFRYEDRTYFRPIDSLREGEWAVTRGRVKGIQDYQTRRRGFSIFQNANPPQLRGAPESWKRSIAACLLHTNALFLRNCFSFRWVCAWCGSIVSG